jgi:diguanylate cyclase (GGDEF)-like protein
LVGRIRTQRDVVLSIVVQTAISLAIALPTTFAITLWYLDGDFSRSLSGWAALRFGLGVTFIECVTVCPIVGYRTMVILRTANNLRDRLHALATRDPLTGLLNRRGFDEAVATLPTGAAAVLVCDIDNFKRINDGYGHDIGDRVLQKVADLLTGLEEARPATLLARFGGEEFVVVLAGASLEHGRLWAEMARVRLVSRRAMGPDGPIAVTASFGVAATEHFDGDISALIARADAALYFAKNEGRNRVAAEANAPLGVRAA